MPRFELTAEKVERYGRTLYRIKALVDIRRDVPKGTLGGFIQKESNLAQDGEGWVYPDGFAFDLADIRGGNIRGGNIRGGNIRGGNIRGGDIRGGDIRGGNIWGGNIWGGNIWGGNIWGGNIWGGDIWGGDIRGGDIVKKSPGFIAGLRWSVTITPQAVTIGCTRFTHARWKKLKAKDVAEHGGKEAVKLWKTYKPFIAEMIKEQLKADRP